MHSAFDRLERSIVHATPKSGARILNDVESPECVTEGVVEGHASGILEVLINVIGV
jgi:hypothetical protein